jgi:hypothetical protein
MGARRAILSTLASAVISFLPAPAHAQSVCVTVQIVTPFVSHTEHRCASTQLQGQIHYWNCVWPAGTTFCVDVFVPFP